MFSLIILILESFCDVLYECRPMLNSTENLQINQLLSYLKRVPGALFSVNLIKFNSELSQM